MRCWLFFNDWNADNFLTFHENELLPLVILRLKDVCIALCSHLVLVPPQMFGNSHIEVHNPHVVSLSAFAETTKVIALIHQHWRIDAHVVLSQVVHLEERGEVQIFLEK